MVARSGQLPVGSGDGLAFQARSDDKGNALDGRCDVRALRHDAAGALLDDHALRSGGRRWCATRVQRHGFTSHEVVRRANGSFEITVVAALAPGQLAADRRHRALRAGAAALRYADRRRHPRPRGDDAGDRAEGSARDPAGALAARRRAARRHRAPHHGAVAARARHPGRLFAARAGARRSMP